MAVVSVSLPDPIVQAMDDLIQDGGYAGRSDVVRAALRELFHRRAADRADRREVRTATITVVYEEGGRRIAEIRHNAAKSIRAALHSHSGENCVEVFVAEGQSGTLKQFVDQLRAAKETIAVEAVYTDAASVIDRM